jgi:hypothetical protein
MRYQEFLACVGKSTKATSRAAFGLMAEPLPEELWMIKQLRSAVAKLAVITFWA